MKNQRTRVKICGITNVEMAIQAVENGADAIGLVFYSPSPRAVTPELAVEIISALPAFVTSVGLFVDEKKTVIEDIIQQTNLDLLQFHGSETPDYCADFSFPYIKALSMSHDINIFEQRDSYHHARSILLDTYRPGIPGGTGESFEWDRIPDELAGEIILAGGLTPGNIVQAIKQVRPYAVDVSGGVESAKGIKDSEKIKQFMRGVGNADK